MAITRQLTLRDDPVEEYDVQFNRNVDAVDTRGVYVQNDTSNDTKALVSRDANDNMTFADGLVQFTRKLVDQLLEALEISTVGTTYTNTISSGRVTQELWKVTAGSINLKSIDYTYTGSKVTTEVRKVFLNDGSTIIGQVTLTYTYTGNIVSGIAQVRNV